jgi:catechol 2,3-dioxygenase-like lactoylglutathione lyase family enzyme
MTCRLTALVVDALEPARVARFWADILGREALGVPDGVLVPGTETQLGLRFVSSPVPKVGRDRMHLHLTSTDAADQQHVVATARRLGASDLDVGQLPEERHVVLADPEGNELCVIEAGNGFLADCGFLGELACDGTQEVGYFWSEALGWPLVWDQDQETSIRSPHGGPKISWGGPPLNPRTEKNRHHFDLEPPADGDQEAEVERLVSLGATRSDVGLGEVDHVVMADPDGNEFWVFQPARQASRIAAGE